MRRLLNILLYIVVGLVGLLLVAAVTLFLLFDPDDFRDSISTAVEKNTGRELTIEGELKLSLFPWLAIDVGESELGNAEGFGDEPFARFERARLSVLLMPMLLSREIAIGTAEIDTLHLNLAVNKSGRTNWDDLVELADAAPDEPEDAAREAAEVDIANIHINNASVSYNDLKTGDSYRLTDFNLSSGTVTQGEPVDVVASAGFEVQPSGLSGTVEAEAEMAYDSGSGIISFDDFSLDGLVEGLADVPTPLKLEIPTFQVNSVEDVLTLGELEMSIIGVDLTANVQPFSYAGSAAPAATISIAAFSPRNLMQRLKIEAPETADPNAFGKMTMSANAKVSEKSIALSGLNMVLDGTTFKGGLTLPRGAGGSYRIDLAADTINLDSYMAPVDGDTKSGGDAAEAPTEIPSDLIRPLKARGKLTVAEVYLSGLKFESVVLELNAGNGQLRLHPVSASLFGGTYNGDVRINVAGSVPALSLDEKVTGVQLAPLAGAMFDRENITGTINGAFKLSGRGQDVQAMQRDLDGNMSFELLDGSWQGTDIWYEIRRARALLKQEPAPEPVLPARTDFSSVAATGVVTDGVFKNNDLLAELPFMRLTGKGIVDLVEANIDYNLTARVLERPEFVTGATDAELDEFTEAVIPMRITGPLSSPSIKPDVAGMLKQEVKKEVEKLLTDKLFGGSDKKKKRKKKQAEEDAAAAGEEPATDETPTTEEEPEEDLEDKAKEALFDLLKN